MSEQTISPAAPETPAPSVQVFDHPSQKVLITGASGTGKTTLFEKLLRKEKARHKFVYDHQGEFAHRFGAKRCSEYAELVQRTAEGGMVCFDPLTMFPGQVPEGFDVFCAYTFEVCQVLKGRKLFICDELQKLRGPFDDAPSLFAILDTGRRYQIDCYFISQAPNLIHNRVRNQITEIYTFRQSDENAIKFLKGHGFDETAVRNLAPGRYQYKHLNTGETGEGGKAFQPHSS